MKGRILFFIILQLVFVSFVMGNVDNKQVKLKSPIVFLRDIPHTLAGEAASEIETLAVRIDGVYQPVVLDEDGAFTVEGFITDKNVIYWKYNGIEVESNVTVLPAWTSIIPPFLAILLAFLMKDVFIALFLGVFSGAFLITGLNPFQAFDYIFNDLLIRVIGSAGNIRIIIFTLSMGGLILLMRKAGGIQDLVSKVTGSLSSPRRGMLASFFAGLLIFFDDYANALMVGSALRHITDKLRISREKLAFLVDATSAPIASIAPVSTWIGYEVSVISAAYEGIGPESGIWLFLQTYPYRFYTLLMLFFVLFIAFMNRDYGPMSKAESRARQEGKVLAPDARPMMDDTVSRIKSKDGQWYFALIPTLTVVAVIIFMFIFTGGQAVGFDAGLQEIFSHASTSNSLVLGPPAGIFVFMLMAKAKGLLSVKKMTEVLVAGSKFVLFAVFVLVLAWSISRICRDLSTAHFLVSLLGDNLSPRFLPALTFILSAVIAFSTGTSYGTMAIVFPLVIPLAHQLNILHEMPEMLSNQIMFSTMGSVLAGSVLGDHCSPISDTTLFSALSTASDHLHHVKTQLPYALTVGIISVVIGYLPMGFGFSPLISITLSIVLMALIVRFVGRKNPLPVEE